MDGCPELKKVRAIYKPRKPPVDGEAEPPRKRDRPAGPMGLGRPAYPLSGSPRSHFSRVDSSHLLEFLSFTIAPLWTLLSWRYLRGMDRIGNPSLNLHLLCLIPKYLARSFGLSWRMDVHECASNQHELWPSSFSVLALDHGPRHFMLQNRPETYKNEVPPKYMCICENDQ